MSLFIICFKGYVKEVSTVYEVNFASLARRPLLVFPIVALDGDGNIKLQAICTAETDMGQWVAFGGLPMDMVTICDNVTTWKGNAFDCRIDFHGNEQFMVVSSPGKKRKRKV